jgi:opacity protein-like surface antigen
MRFRHCMAASVVVVVAGAAAPARAQLVATPYIDTNVAGDVQTGRGGLGASLGYYFRGLFGFELDVERHPHFFRDEDVAHLVPAGVDLDTHATLFMGNLVAPVVLSGTAGTWCPYGAAGLGLIHAVFESHGRQAPDKYEQRDLTFNIGAGVMHALTDIVGFRVDARYFHALVDENARQGGYAKDYGFWRVSVGVTFGFPR